jgi:urease accessory protein
MTIVDQIHPVSALDRHAHSYRIESITLAWEDRRQGHGRRRSDAGTEFGISLPAGTVLKQDDAFVLNEEKVVVVVREALEPVYIIRPATPQEWAFYAYHVGNRHQQVMIGETELIFLQSPAVRSLLEQFRVRYTSGERPFTGALATVHTH